MTEKYDSTSDTLEHIRQVKSLLESVGNILHYRAVCHDASKLESPEKEIFDEMTPKLAACTYGSEEYKAFLAQMKPALDHHYAANSHHPEHYRWRCGVCDRRCNDAEWVDAPQGPNDSGWRYCPTCSLNGLLYESQLISETDKGLHGMSLMDLIEMLCDWKAATLRHNDGNIRRSIEINQKRFGYSDELKQILINSLSLIERWPGEDMPAEGGR